MYSRRNDNGTDEGTGKTSIDWNLEGINPNTTIPYLYRDWDPRPVTYMHNRIQGSDGLTSSWPR